MDIQIEIQRDFNYDPFTGKLTRRIGSGDGFVKGRGSEGTNNNGYLCFTWKGKPYFAHRLIWVYCYGDWPTGEIDHINGVKSDNRLDNLRDVTPAINNLNKKSNPTKGITIRKRGNEVVYVARFQRRNFTKNLGVFTSLIEAQKTLLRFQINYDQINNNNVHYAR